jgi:D-glycero-D-manno-heptose 1,7-bisphosphate phosphatase
MLDLSKIDKSWTLFLDRDGVINVEKYLDYVYNYAEFTFYEGTPEALKKLSKLFGRLIIITNQRGVEKKLMTEDALIELHKEMLGDIETSGGKIDAIYYCTSLDNNHPNRKPQAGMALLAKKTFPEINFSKAIMIGNNLSDMFFGRNAGTYTVYVKTTNRDVELPHPAIDLVFNDLADFADNIK